MYIFFLSSLPNYPICNIYIYIKYQISCKTLNQLDGLCRHIRGTGSPFGGIQLIFAGDFFQLPPVADIYYGDPGDHCFRSPVFCHLHHFCLTEVKRQLDDNFVLAINKASLGDLDPETITFLTALSRPLPTTGTPSPLPALHIVATRFEAECLNADYLSEMDGDWQTYEATDEG